MSRLLSILLGLAIAWVIVVSFFSCVLAMFAPNHPGDVGKLAYLLRGQVFAAPG